MKTLHVRKVSVKMLRETLEMLLPGNLADPIYIRCNKTGIINWKTGTIYTEENLHKIDAYIIVQDKDINYFSGKFQWKVFAEYVKSYNSKQDGRSNTTIIIKDILYGMGISLNKEFKFGEGYAKFIRELTKFNIEKEGNTKQIGANFIIGTKGDETFYDLSENEQKKVILGLKPGSFRWINYDEWKAMEEE